MSREDRVKVEIWLDDDSRHLLVELIEGPRAGTDLDTGLREETLHEHVPKRFRSRLAAGEVITWLAPASLVESWLSR